MKLLYLKNRSPVLFVLFAFEGEAVEGGEAVGGDGGAVVAGGVALVDFPMIFGILLSGLPHPVVTVGVG